MVEDAADDAAAVMKETNCITPRRRGQTRGIDLGRPTGPVDGRGHEYLLAFSCKGRGLCPSCGAKRAAEFATFLQDEVVAHHVK